MSTSPLFLSPSSSVWSQRTYTTVGGQYPQGVTNLLMAGVLMEGTVWGPEWLAQAIVMPLAKLRTQIPMVWSIFSLRVYRRDCLGSRVIGTSCYSVPAISGKTDKAILLYLPFSWIIHGLLFFESSTRGELFLKESGKKKRTVNFFYIEKFHISKQILL